MNIDDRVKMLVSLEFCVSARYGGVISSSF